MTGGADSEGRYCDVHSHLVPGVDDGARSVDDVLEGVGRMVACGIGRILTTPHIDASLTLSPDRLDRRISDVEEAWERARSAVSERFPSVDARCGFEVKVDVPDADFSERNLWLAGTDYILVEWPRMRVPPSSAAVVRRIAESGPRPIIAHPERYGGLDPELRTVETWREAGALLQVNYGSVVGRYGARAAEVALRLLERGWVHYLSTDFHGRPHLDLYHGEAKAKLASLGFPEQFEMLAAENTARLFENREPLEVSPIVVSRGLWDRLRGMLGA